MKRESLTAGYVARLLNTEVSFIKLWAKRFPEYLSHPTNQQNEPRIYTQSDLRVFAVINDSYEWRKDDDNENADAYPEAYCALNSNTQNNEHYIELAYLHSPIFQEVPDEIGQSEPCEYGVIIGGMAQPAKIDIAQAYKLAADMLVDLALTTTESDSTFNLYGVVWPILFNYRHCIEIYLKILTNYSEDNPTHSIESLINSLREKYKPLKINDWIKNLLVEWSSIDDRATAFRYPEDLQNGEYWVDFYHLKAVMGILCNAFEELITRNAKIAS